jgi:hypothetical protein
MDNILSLDELKSRISDYYTEKKAADMPPEQDPQETTPPNFVKDDGDDASKMVVPDAAVSATNSDGSAENNIPGMSSGEASGKEPGKTETTDVTADKSKQKQDEAVDDPVTAKVATQGLTLAERIKERLMGKEAGYGKDEGKSDKDSDNDGKKDDSAALKGDQNKLPTDLKEKIIEKKEASEAPEVAEEVAEGSVVETEKSAEEVASDFDLEPDAYRKIAHLVLGYEEGRELLDSLADKELGKQAAEQLIAEAEHLGAQEEQAHQEQQKQAAQIEKLASTATEEDQKVMSKMAAIHQKAVSALEFDFEKQAYDAGAEAAASAADEEDGMIPGNEGEDVSIEEIAEIVMAMVESGELDPQLAEAILAELAGAAPGGEEAAMGGMGGGEEAAMEEAMMADPAMAEEMKAASAEIEKSASLIEAALKQD